MRLAVSIVLLTKNAGPDFPQVLRAIFNQNIDFFFEVIAVDSGSTNETVERLKKFPLKLYQIPRNQFGHGKTRNWAATKAKGEILVFLVQDAKPRGQNWLVSLLEPFEDPKVAGVFGRQIPKKETPLAEEYFLSCAYPGKRRVMKESLGNFRLGNIFFSNVNSAVRKNVWQKFPFNEELVMSEDQEWARRAAKKGYKIVYQPKAGVYHGHRYRLKTLFKRNLKSGYSMRQMGERGGISLIHGLKYLWGEVAWLKKKGRFYALPGVLFFELVRLVGFWLGSSFIQVIQGDAL